MSSNRYEQQKLDAIAACRAGRFAEAETQLRELLHVLQQHGGDIENSQVRYWYLVARHSGDTAAAMEAFMRPVGAEELVERRSDHGPARFQDDRFDRAIDLLTRDMAFAPQEFFQGRAAPSESACTEALDLLDQLRSADAGNLSVHAAYAFALEIAGKAVSAAAQLAEISQRFPESREISLMSQRQWLWVVNPLKLPPFEPPCATIHPAINANLISSLIILTRAAALPRAVLFLKDAAGDFDARALQHAKMQFTTLISPVSTPQLVGVMGRIFDNPSNPFDLENIEAPFRPHSHPRRITFEFFVRQRSFSVVIVDRMGRVMHAREVDVSDRMAAAHQTLQRRFDTEPGEEMPWDDIAAAIRRHQAVVDPKHVPY